MAFSEKEARARFWIIDKDGLLDNNRGDLSDAQKTYARDGDEVKNWPRNSHGQIGLSEAIAQLDATILIGLSTVQGIFTETVVHHGRLIHQVIRNRFTLGSGFLLHCLRGFRAVSDQMNIEIGLREAKNITLRK
jgi:Malic enzyme, NAD binding domain